MTKNQKSYLRKKADRLWFEKALEKYGNQCELCGNDYGLQVHHFFYKGSYPQLRYDLENGVVLCKACHFRLHHRDPKLMNDAIIKKRGKRWYNKLKKKAQQPLTPSFKSVKYYQDVIKALQEG